MFTVQSRPMIALNRTETNDIKDVGDIVIGITGSESKGEKAASIAGYMNCGDSFISEKYAIHCYKED